MKTIHTMRYTLIAALLVCTVSSYAQKTAPTVYGTHTNINTNTNEETIHTDKDGKTYEMTFADNKMTSLSIDGKSIPADKWGEYKTFINEILEQVKKDKIQAEKDRKQAAKDRERANLDRARAEKDREQAVRDRKQAELDRQQAEKDKIQGDQDRKQAELDRAQATKDREQADRDRVQAEKDRQQAALDRVQAEKDRAAAEEDRKLIAKLLSDVVEDKLVTTKSEIHQLVINNEGMQLNGQKQSEDVHRKYLTKYQDYIKNGISYRAENGHVQIQRNWNGRN